MAPHYSARAQGGANGSKVLGLLRISCISALLAAVSGGAAAQPAPGSVAPGAVALVADRTCSALAARVDAVPGGVPVLLRSWDGAAGSGPPAEPALAGAAFTYDNALAAIALVACGRLAQAGRVGAALLAAVSADRSGRVGRIRNAYRAGAQGAPPLPPNGWWDAVAGRWAEDATQVGTATGNVAWAGLALLTLGQATGEARWREGAERLARWAVETEADSAGPGGFGGGIVGYDDAPRPAGWKSTEHNADLAALFGWLARTDPRWRGPERAARAFLAAMWQDADGRFLLGTLPDGRSPNRAGSGLDAQLWPLLLPAAPAAWRRATLWVERRHGVAGGFDFNDDRDGLWVEGTAQAALVWRTLGRGAQAASLFATLAGQASPGGYLWATREAVVTTGLALGPASTTADFVYRRRPALAATAWAALAALGWNPFTGAHSP